MTVCDLTIMSAERHCSHNRESMTQNKRSAVLNRARLFVRRCSTAADGAAQESRFASLLVSQNTNPASKETTIGQLSWRRKNYQRNLANFNVYEPD
jgi:hypothetical protein